MVILARCGLALVSDQPASRPGSTRSRQRSAVVGSQHPPHLSATLLFLPQRKKSSGDVNLAQDEDLRQILSHRQTWEKVLAVLESEEMPPASARQPDDATRKLLIKFVKETLGNLDCKKVNDPGKPVLRRLTRREYDRCIEDLLGMNLQLATSFAPDPVAYGFDNIGDAQPLSPAQIEQYHEAAKQAIAKLLADNKARTRLLGPNNDHADASAAKEFITRFASHAFRRPVEANYVDRVMKVFERCQAKKMNHHDSVGQMMIAVLLSPQFLLRLEQDQPGNDKSYAVDDYELASRLSFFLWARGPDEELMQLAREKKLHDDNVLSQQVTRMLKDPRSVGLVDGFFGQWLGLNNFPQVQPSKQAFPSFDDELRQAMQLEVSENLKYLLREDRPITELLDANYTHLTPKLARHYGIKHPGGTSSLARVELTDHKRGGLLTTSAILMLQSDPARTNIPKRGNFIAGQILGTPSPPPPPDVPTLEQSTKNQKLSVRKMLELHRKNATCASCHNKIDPLGLAFENYDAIGAWRDKDAGETIDPTGELPDGRAFAGPEALKQILLEQKEQFTKQLSKNLLIYALGRGLQPNDECVIRSALDSAARNQDRVSSIIKAIVQSYPFRHRRNPEY